MTASAPAASRASFFAPLRVTARGTAPSWRATWIAASPTALEAAVIRTWSPGRVAAFSTSAP
ncbi:hypothetical protein ACIQ64_09585 [Streptomyces sp. NPDC094473]|uniref:hypothetical protein n=1 Tax=Streptomyces sp. NPDC094473 TaxID=3366068 RepID=UPI0037FE0C18